MVDERVDFLVAVRMAEKARALVDQKQVFVLIDDG